MGETGGALGGPPPDAPVAVAWGATATRRRLAGGGVEQGKVLVRQA
jgi:hypothetical protein